MAQVGSIKHAFPGSNTPNGFYSFFNYILPQEEANQLYVIKGGPGTGKSSFMKRMGTYATEQGFDVEFFHCSSDPGSLDAMVIPSLKIAFLDGTSPHVVDPIAPGVTDQILNFGTSWDADQLIPHKEEIFALSNRIHDGFTKAYYYLAAAKNIYDAYIFTESQAIDRNTKIKIEKNLMDQVFKNVKDKGTLGNVRHLFSTAITGEGVLDYIHTIIGATKNVYFIKESFGCNSKEVMQKISDTAVSKGYNVACYHSPMDPSKIEDIIISELDLAITVSHPLHKPRIFPALISDFTTALDSTTLKNLDFELDKDKRLFLDLIDKACNRIATNKKYHDELEKYYIQAIDFTSIDALYESLIKKIFS